MILKKKEKKEGSHETSKDVLAEDDIRTDLKKPGEESSGWY